MTDTPHTPSIAHDASLPGAEVPKDDEVSTSFVLGLKAPPLASGYERAIWRMRPEAASTQLLGAALPSHGLHVVTSIPRTGIDDPESIDKDSSGLPSPDPSSPGLRTPMDSPPTRPLHVSKDNVPDIEHLVIRDRAQKRVLTGPSPSARDVMVGAQLTNVVGGPRPLTSQGYEVVIDILEEEGNYKSNEPHALLIDTGSDDTFVFGEGVLKITQSENGGGGRHGRDLEPRVPWIDEDVLLSPSHTFVRHGGFDPKLTNDQLQKYGPIGRVKYADGTIAHLGLGLPRTWVLHGYDWKRKQPHQVYLAWQFGVAFAVSRSLFKDTTSGMLGLGLTGIQHAYLQYNNAGNVARPATFLEELQKRLKRIPAIRLGERMVMYFCLRMVPEFYPSSLRSKHAIQSWMSFNDWPCDHEPDWNSEKIIVHTTDSMYRRWSVYLRSIRFVFLVGSICRPLGPLRPDAYIDGTELNFVDAKHPQGMLTLLDTGTSVTLFPLHVVQRIHEKLFDGKTTIKATDEGPNVETYEIDPQRSWAVNPNTKIQVVYEFAGEKAPVIVYGPFEMFFYQQNPKAGCSSLEPLVYPQGPSSEDAVLGLNFFQSMYVSLHNSTDGTDFVRMAGQWPEHLPADLEKFHIPGISSR